MTRVSGDWIEAGHVQAVLAMLAAGGHRALLVGGCVRNALLGMAVSDIDIATDALPERVSELALAAGLKPVPTGFDHGTVTVVAEGVPHEVTTFRRDVETTGRHAVVTFASHVEVDASRRDFTINALYAEADGRVIDPLGTGLADVAARRVRFVGMPGERITEDYLRILRFFRFHAHHGDPAEGIDAEGLAACALHAEGIDGLARERVGQEMRKLLQAPDPLPALAAMQATGILARVLPGASIQALGPLLHLEPPYGPETIRRLAALGGVDPVSSLRLGRAEAHRLKLLREAAGNTVGGAELGYRLGAANARDVLLLRAASLGSTMPPDWEYAVALGAAARFPVTAADLMPALQGPALGRKLEALETLWVDSGFRLSRDELLA